jgi:hypothetical protein
LDVEVRGKLRSYYVFYTYFQRCSRLDHGDADNYPKMVVEFDQDTRDVLERTAAHPNRLTDLEERMRLEVLAKVPARVNESHFLRSKRNGLARAA